MVRIPLLVRTATERMFGDGDEMVLICDASAGESRMATPPRYLVSTVLRV